MPRKKPNRVTQLLAQYDEQQRVIKARALVEGARLALMQAADDISHVSSTRASRRHTHDPRLIQGDLRSIALNELAVAIERLNTLADEREPK